MKKAILQDKGKNFCDTRNCVLKLLQNRCLNNLR